MHPTNSRTNEQNSDPMQTNKPITTVACAPAENRNVVREVALHPKQTNNPFAQNRNIKMTTSNDPSKYLTVCINLKTAVLYSL